MIETKTQTFPSTRWTVVLTAGMTDRPEARDCLEILCRSYWYPLYVFARHRGQSPEDAEDLVQGFFTRVIEKSALAQITPDKGKFRAFLLASFRNYLNNAWDYERTQRRGNGAVHLPFDSQQAESRYADNALSPLTPEQLFDREWALSILGRAMGQLRSEFGAAGREEVFEALEGHLTGTKPSPPYTEIAPRLGINEAALRMIVTRLRRRYGELVRLEIAETLESEEKVGEELRHLLDVLSGCG